MSKDTGGPAFPTGTAFQGMTLRDYFAAKAMQGELASEQDDYEWHSYEKLAKHCYNIADAMLSARGTEKVRNNNE